MKKGVISVVSLLAGLGVGAVAGAEVVGNKVGQEKKKMQKMSDKHLALFLMMNQWVKVKQDGKNLASYLEKKGYKKIGIYGMSYAGETLLRELQDTAVEVVYGIDQNADFLYSDISIVSIEQELEEVDAIVVTAISFFDEIEEKLNAKVSCPILSLEDILYEI